MPARLNITDEERKERSRIASAKWRKKNLVKHRKTCRRWRLMNRAKSRESSSKWRSRNREKCNETSRQWMRANLVRIRVWKRKRALEKAFINWTKVLSQSRASRVSRGEAK